MQKCRWCQKEIKKGYAYCSLEHAHADRFRHPEPIELDSVEEFWETEEKLLFNKP